MISVITVLNNSIHIVIMLNNLKEVLSLFYVIHVCQTFHIFYSVENLISIYVYFMVFF